MIELVEENLNNARIVVVGVGGGGGNAVEHMIRSGVQNVDFICANTDAQALNRSSARHIIQLGDSGLMGSLELRSPSLIGSGEKDSPNEWRFYAFYEGGRVTITDTLPAQLTNASWTCAASAGSSCQAASGTGSINTIVNLGINGTATFTITATISATATGTLTNSASVAVPTGATDPNPNNNTAIDTDTLTPLADLCQNLGATILNFFAAFETEPSSAMVLK